MSKLTRYLYEVDEANKSFVTCMINKINIKECYFWIFELYYSKIDIFPIIWQLYLDYYATINPKMENYIIKREKLSKNPDENPVEHICYIIKNLHILNSNNDVFMLRQLCNQEDLCLTKINEIRGRSPKWTKLFKKKHIKLLISIKKRQYNNICYYLTELIKPNSSDNEDLYRDIILYYSTERGCDITDVERNDELLKQIKNNWNLKVKNNCHHYLLAIICQMNIEDHDLIEQKIYIAPNRDDIDEIKSRYETYGISAHKILKLNRCYNIDKSIGMFSDLSRFNFNSHDEYTNEIRDHWEYYAHRTPYWREIIDNYEGEICEETRSIRFNDDEKTEAFYNIYGYELDEQSLTVQNMSLSKLDIKSVVTGCSILIEFPDNFKLFK